MINKSLIDDVHLNVTVEFGRTHMQLKDILTLGPGSLIELDTIKGEPLNIFVNNKFVAKGNVVVIDNVYGIEVTEFVR